MANPTIGLAEAISALRKELLLAIDAGEGAPMRFRLAPVELSLQVAVTKEGNGKIGWHVLGLGASYESATTQTLKLRLEPAWRRADGTFDGDFLVTDQQDRAPAFGPSVGNGTTE
jgi:hypothetical protein